MTVTRGTIALSSTGELVLITASGPQAFVDAKGNEAMCYKGIYLEDVPSVVHGRMIHRLGQPWIGLEEPREVAHTNDFDVERARLDPGKIFMGIEIKVGTLTAVEHYAAAQGTTIDEVFDEAIECLLMVDSFSGL